jgi:hypothetical protein
VCLNCTSNVPYVSLHSFKCGCFNISFSLINLGLILVKLFYSSSVLHVSVSVSLECNLGLLLGNTWEHNPSLETNSRPDGKEFPLHFMESAASLTCSIQLDSILSQTNQVHTTISCYFKIHFSYPPIYAYIYQIGFFL